MKAKVLCYALALCVVAWAGPAAAVQAVGPICDTNAKVTSTTYYGCNTNNGYHAALDIGNGTCNVWNMRGMLVGNHYYTVKASCGNYCYGSSCPNYAIVYGSNTWRFGQFHMNPSAESYSRTCDRCALGLVGGTGQATGPHVHAENVYNGTLQSAWYGGYVTCGSSGYCGNTMGYPRLN